MDHLEGTHFDGSYPHVFVTLGASVRITFIFFNLILLFVKIIKKNLPVYRYNIYHKFSRSPYVARMTPNELITNENHSHRRDQNTNQFILNVG